MFYTDYIQEKSNLTVFWHQDTNIQQIKTRFGKFTFIYVECSGVI